MSVTRVLLFVLTAGVISLAGQEPPTVAEGASALKKATFAGGCFWCMEPPFDELDGVVSTTSGYTGGHQKNPTYAAVSAGRTGHTEAVEVLYDPAKITYAQLLEVFWRNIDPLVNGNRKPHICGNRKLRTSGEDVSAGADILPVMPVGRVGLDAGSGATGVLANTRREAAEPAVTWRLPHAVRPTLSSASADAPASGSCCPGC